MKGAEQLRIALATVGEALIATDARGCAKWLNPQAEALTGWSEADARGRPLDEVFRTFSERAGVPVENAARRALREGHAVQLASDKVLLAKDGTEHAIAGAGAPICDENDAIVGALLVFRDESNERQSATRLRRAEEDRFAAFFDNAPIGHCMAAPDGTVLRANPALCAMLGYSAEELRAISLLSITHPDDLAETREAVRALLAGESASFALEKRFKTKAGGDLWAYVSVRLMRDPENMPLYTVTHVLDIGPRQKADTDLRVSESRYRRLFEAAKDGILILDADSGRIVDVNPFLMDLTGYSRDELLDKALWEVGSFRDIAASKVSFAKLQSDKYVRYEDLPLKTRDGRTIDVEFVSNVYRIGGQRVIQCNIRDISQRKRADAERMRLSMAIEQSAEVVMLTDVRGTIEYANPAFERTTGYSRAEVLGLNPRLLKSGVQDEAFYRKLWATLTSGQPWTGRLVNKKKDGTLYSEDATISPVRDLTGTTTGYVAVKRDLTATLALEAQLLHAQKMEAVGQLAGGVAHDFNNVLSVILSYADLIVGDLKPGDPFRADIEEIRAAGVRAAALTRQLLAFSRQQVLEAKVLNLNLTLAGMEKMLHRLLGADVELTLLTAAGLWSVKADPGQFEQIVMNLAVNARDAMPRGGQLTIETANVELDDQYAMTHAEIRAGAYVQVAVSDTGTGMEPATQKRIFEPFFTTKDKGKGTGLGLATVFGIVKQSGGHIEVYSEWGKGTTFKMYFPRVAAVADARPSEAVALEPDLGNETILLVEDDDALRVVARTILRRHGYVVLEAANGGEALLVCEQHGAKIHLLLTDVVLPRMSGRQLADRLATLRPEMKVIFMSGYTDDAILQHGILESGVPFLQKPFTPTSLTRKVREELRGSAGG
jgi:PAS domain S-box-containing protein